MDITHVKAWVINPVSPARALLGAVTLKEIGLGLDPLRKELIPIPLPLTLWYLPKPLP